MSTMTIVEDVATWQRLFEETQKQRAATPAVGLMDLKTVPGEYKYAVAVREGTHLWLVLWIRRNPRGEYFVLKPMGNRNWNPHSSYHIDGTRHDKSFGRRVLPPRKLQPLTGQFRGTMEFPLWVVLRRNPLVLSVIRQRSQALWRFHLAFWDHGMAVSGCFLLSQVLSPRTTHGHMKFLAQKLFADVSPHIVIAVMREKP